MSSPFHLPSGSLRGLDIGVTCAELLPWMTVPVPTQCESNRLWCGLSHSWNLLYGVGSYEAEVQSPTRGQCMCIYKQLQSRVVRLRSRGHAIQGPWDPGAMGSTAGNTRLHTLAQSSAPEPPPVSPGAALSSGLQNPVNGGPPPTRDVVWAMVA